MRRNILNRGIKIAAAYACLSLAIAPQAEASEATREKILSTHDNLRVVVQNSGMEHYVESIDDARQLVLTATPSQLYGPNPLTPLVENRLTMLALGTRQLRTTFDPDLLPAVSPDGPRSKGPPQANTASALPKEP